MPAVLADLSISARWIVPMTSCDQVLENHTLVVRDGRILDILPTSAAAYRYAASVHVDRSPHLLLPGLVNSHTRLAPAADRSAGSGITREGALLCIAEMLRAGTTCFCNLGPFPEESARIAAEQGLRALIGIPTAEHGPLTEGLHLRDEYRGHPSIATAFAPQGATLGDATLTHVATLANELDAGIVMPLHASLREIDESVEKYGLRPIERMHALGLLTPALTALHMVHVDAADLEFARRSGIAVVLCPQSNLRGGLGAPPAAAWKASGLRLGLGSGADSPAESMDLWSELRLLALLSGTADAGVAASAWEALAAATRGGAAALGLDADIGTLEIGKWADVCCLDLRHPSTQRALRYPRPSAADGMAREDLFTAVVFNGARDLVSDVWVAGRQLLNGGAFTRLDWSEACPARPARKNHL